MRALAGVLILIVLALLGVLLFRSDVRAPALQPAPERSAPVSHVEQPLSSTTVEAAGSANESARQAAHEPAAPAPTIPACAVFGMVVDEQNTPLVGAQVRLSAYKGWAEGQEVPRSPGKLDIHGFETTTDAQGKFRFGVPLPTIATVQLTVLPDGFHDSAREYLGGTDARFRPPLHSGENDLGLFRLAATGAIRGRVADASGAPLENAHFTVGSDRSMTIGRDADSDSAGNFLIGHVPPGSYGVNAKCAGFLSEFRKPVEVRIGQVTGPVDYALLPAPVLGGAVVDEQGRGLEGAKLWSWPSTSGAGAGGRSSADGSFSYFLPQDEPYTLEVTLDGYDSFGVDDRATHYAQNTRDLRIVLKKSEAAKTRFAIIDESSGAKIEVFGLEIERDRGSRAERGSWTSYRPHPKPLAHPGGEVDVSARPGLDLYTVVAPGYTRKSGDVEHSSKDSSLQTVKLARGGGLLGRALVGAAPAAAVTLRLEAGTWPIEETASERSKSGRMFIANSDDVQQVSTAADGRFRIDSLSPGSYRLTLRAPTGESLEVVPVRIRMKGDTDVGDLVLQKGATVVGRILVPERRQRQGLVVSLDGPRSTVKQTSDAEGRVRFEGLTAGHHSLTLDDVPGLLAEGAEAEVDVTAGESQEVVIDARDRGTCKVVLTIEIPGQSVEGLEVYLGPLEDPTQSLHLGSTDAKGVVSGFVRAAGMAKVAVQIPRGTSLLHPSAQVPLLLDRNVESTVRFEVGSVRLEIPSSLQLPSEGSATLYCPGNLNAGSTPILMVTGIGVALDQHNGMELEADGRHFLAKLFPVGEFDVDFLILSLESVSGPQEVYRSDIHLAIRAGETTDIRLP